MKTRLLTLIVTVLALFVAVVPSFAQSASVTLTEDRINQTFRVTNPPRATVSNVRVDLQVGQAVINLTVTPRRGNQTPIGGSVTLVPSIVNGQVNWTAASASANGNPASGDNLAVLNSIANGWSTYFRAQARGTVTAISISDTAITYSLATSGTTNPTITVGVDGTSLSLSEADISSNLAIRGVSSLRADCQPNQVVLSGSYTSAGKTYSVQAVLVPNLANNRVNWSLSSLTVDGEPAATQATTRLQNAALTAFQSFWNRRAGRATVTAISVSDSAITWTVNK